MPWTSDRFAKNITPGVGVWTTEENTMAMLQVAYQLLLEGRVAVADGVVTVDRGAFDPRAKRVAPDTAVALLATQLAQFTDDERTGKITGKTSGGDNDDVGRAFLMAVYWRICALAADESIVG
jgi:hypothetical protein